MVLKGVEEIDWFTDRPERVEGTWKPQKLIRKWDKYFATSEPNAQVTFKIIGLDNKRQILNFEMLKPRLKMDRLVFNLKPLSEEGKDKITGYKGNGLGDLSLYIDNSISGNTLECYPNCTKKDFQVVNFKGVDLSGSCLPGVNLTGARLNRAILSNANFNSANLSNAYLSGARLINTNLKNANLDGANLNGVDFSNANLSGASFNGATLRYAIFRNTVCPDGTKNKDYSRDFEPCTPEQLNLA